MDANITQPGLDNAALLVEKDAYQKQQASKSYLAQAVSSLTEFIHGSSAQQAKLEELSGRANVLRMAGATDAAGKMRAEIESETEKSRKARGRDEEVTGYGTNFLKTTALFYPGMTGRVAAGVVGALDGARESDSFLSGSLGGLAGGTKLVAQKVAMERIGKLETNFAAKAFLTGMTFRASETVFSGKTWLDKETGAVDPLAAVGRTLGAAGDPRAAAHDLVVFGGAHLAMGHVKTYGFDLMRSRVSATVVSGAMFGLSSGTFNELKRSQEQLVPFDYSRALMQGALDSVAALPGGLRAQSLARRDAALNVALKSEPMTRQPANTETFSGPADLRVSIEAPAQAVPKRHEAITASVARLPPISDLSGGLPRQFLVVAGHEHLNAFVLGGKSSALLQVREVHTGSTGDSKSMVVQHLDATLKPTQAAGKADLIASCHPELLAGSGLQGRHVLPDASGRVVLSQRGSLISFAPHIATRSSALLTELPAGPVLPGSTRMILLNRSVAELLGAVPEHARYRDLHNLEDFATAVRGYPVPGKRILGGGVDSMAIELVTGRVLKMTEKPFDPLWGTRTFIDPISGNPRRFDAKLLSEPKTIEVNGKQITIYLQEKVQMPISPAHLRFLVDRIDSHSRYQFWDIDFTSPHGQSQAGYSKLPGGRRGLVVVDYDSVRFPEDVPPAPSGPQRFLITPWD
ncbi:MAG: hypothetical protein K2W95_22795 [Candidatus Obscuribacterales bacterium]|nr:hypothetical protein [Candidatus Obscuribacterales bacterium]